MEKRLEKKRTLLLDMYGVIIKESKGYFIPYTFEHFDKKEHDRLTRVFREECLFTKAGNDYDILVGEEFSCLEFHMDRDTISWILKIEYRRSIMEKLLKYTHENGIDYVLVGDYYIPMLTLPEKNRHMQEQGKRFLPAVQKMKYIKYLRAYRG